MKIVDYGICFTIFFIGMLCMWSYKSQLLSAHMLTESQIGQIVDEAVRDSLEKAIQELYKNGKDPILDMPEYRQELISDLSRELAFILGGDTLSEMERYAESKILIGFLVWADEVYIYKNGTFDSREILDSNAPKNTQIINIMEKAAGNTLNLPYNSGEVDMNTIGDYSFTIIYESDKGVYGDHNYIFRCFSSAKAVEQ